VALGLGLGLHVGEDLLTLGSRVVADLGRFAARLGELRLVLGELLLRLGLGLLGTTQTTLDSLLSLIENLLELRKDELPEEPEDDGERDERPDDVIQRRNERVGAFLQGERLPLGRQEGDDVVHGASLRGRCVAIRTGSRRRYRSGRAPR